MDRSSLKRLGRDSLVSIWGNLITPSAVGAAALVIGGTGALFERHFLPYQSLPPHARIVLPCFCALAGVCVALAATLFIHKNKLFHRTGLRDAFPIRNYNNATAAWSPRHMQRGVSEIKNILRATPESGTIRLLLLSGHYYIGTGTKDHIGCLDDSLHFPARVRVLLLNPFAETSTPTWWAERRAQQADPDERTPAEDYVQGIQRVVAHLNDIREQRGHDLRVGFYNFSPSWQLFLNDQRGMIQPVAAGRHSQYNPMYLFDYSRASLFVPFQRYFDLLWQRWEEHLAEHATFYKTTRLFPNNSNEYKSVHRSAIDAN